MQQVDQIIPNQVNNVLGFPFIFRGALDARASRINMEMKIAATNALAQLARQDVPDEVAAAYSGEELHYGPQYIIPTPFDPRLITTIPPAVAKAAAESGVAQKPIKDYSKYHRELAMRLDQNSFNDTNDFFKSKRQPEKNGVCRICLFIPAGSA